MQRKYKPRGYTDNSQSLYQKVLSSGKAIVLAGNCSGHQNGITQVPKEQAKSRKLWNSQANNY